MAVLLLLLLAVVRSAATSRTTTTTFTSRRDILRNGPSLMIPRGGSTRVLEEDEQDDADQTPDITTHPEYQKLLEFRMKQQELMQIRSVVLAEALKRRGLPILNIVDVCVPDSEVPKEKVDWDCAMATEEERRECIMTGDAEPGTKVVAPAGTGQWVSIYVLNRSRRKESKNADGTWHGKYDILDGWFNNEKSEYSFLHYTGTMGYLVNSALNNLPIVLTVTVIAIVWQILPLLLAVLNRLFNSSQMWESYTSWARFYHSSLAIRLMLAEYSMHGIKYLFEKLESAVKRQIVEFECELLERTIPVTMGPGSEDDETVGEEEFFDAEENEVLDAQEEKETFYDAQEEEEIFYDAQEEEAEEDEEEEA